MITRGEIFNLSIALRHKWPHSILVIIIRSNALLAPKDLNYYLASNILSEMPNEQFFSYTMARTNYIQWTDDDVHFVLDQHS